MSVWLTIPSKRRPDEVIPLLRKWHDMGYSICIQRDLFDPLIWPDMPTGSIIEIDRDYKGYPEAATHCIHYIMEHDPNAEWFVCAGDDITPDPNKRADEIAAECCKEFARRHYGEYAAQYVDKDAAGSYGKLSTFGVMQPTGDRWGEGQRGNPTEAHIDTIAGSPWIGREFARRMYGGKGPYHTEYFHMFDDQELQEVATMMGVFWQRKDITHYHHWCQRDGGSVPEFLKLAYSSQNWAAMRQIFQTRKRAGFPGHEPIP